MEEQASANKRRFISFAQNTSNVEGPYVPLFIFLTFFYTISFIYIVYSLGKFNSSILSGEILNSDLDALFEKTNLLQSFLFITFIVNLFVVYYFFKTVLI